jgi:dihydrofolate synthase / folylpolyglutamate synthase
MLVAVTIPGEKNALPADAIAAAARAVGIAARAAGSIGEAIRHLAGHRSGRVLICGSLYFAGKVLGENG